MKLYHEPFFKFAFSDHRKIEKIHLPESKPNSHVIVCKFPSPSKNPDDIIAEGLTNQERWLVFPCPIIVMPGDIFYAIEQAPS